MTDITSKFYTYMNASILAFAAPWLATVDWANLNLVRYTFAVSQVRARYLRVTCSGVGVGRMF